MPAARYHGARVQCVLLAAALLAGCETAPDELRADWVELFDGRSLDGWTLIGGDHPVVVEDGVIVGTAVLGEPSAFLLSDAEFSDFILDAEFRIDGVLNSGIIFRSQPHPDPQIGGVQGYQMEIDPGPRGWSGGLYAEGLPWGWLYPPTLNPPCLDAYRAGSWNSYRIEAIGPLIETFVNGVPCARITDDRISRGRIALQFHGVERTGARGFAGDEVAWRSVRVRTHDLAAVQIEAAPDVPHYSYRLGEMTPWEQRAGWRSIDAAPGEPGAFFCPQAGGSEADWRWRAGTLSAAGEGTAPLLSCEPWTDFEFTADFRVTDGTRGRVGYLRGGGDDRPPPNAPGFEIIGDSQSTQAFFYTEGGREMGAVRNALAAANLSEPLPIMRINPEGMWNRLRIVVRGGRVEHWLNSIKLVEYDLDGDVAASLAVQRPGLFMLELDNGAIELTGLKIRRPNDGDSGS